MGPLWMFPLHCVVALRLLRAEGPGDPDSHLSLPHGVLRTPAGCGRLTHRTVPFLCQPSPIKKERSPRPQSFCHSSSISPQDKLSLPGFSTPRDKQRLSYGAFTNQIFVSTSTDSPTSPTTEAPPLPPRNSGKGTSLEKAFRVHPQS